MACSTADDGAEAGERDATDQESTRSTSAPVRAEPIAATVFLDGGVAEIERADVDALTGLIMGDLLGLTILFEDETERHVRAVVTRRLVLLTIADSLMSEPVGADALEEVRVRQVRQLHGELIYFNEQEPQERAEIIALNLRPYLDVVATLDLKRSAIDDFETRAGEVAVALDPEIGLWDSAGLEVIE